MHCLVIIQSVLYGVQKIVLEGKLCRFSSTFSTAQKTLVFRTGSSYPEERISPYLQTRERKVTQWWKRLLGRSNSISLNYLLKQLSALGLLLKVPPVTLGERFWHKWPGLNNCLLRHRWIMWYAIIFIYSCYFPELSPSIKWQNQLLKLGKSPQVEMMPQ